MLPTEAGSTFFQKYEKKMLAGEKWTWKPSNGGCNACIKGHSPPAQGRTQFYSRILIQKKVATDNEYHRWFTKEHTFGSNCPRDVPYQKIIESKESSTGTGQIDMGQEMIRGSNTPWAEGPANFFFLFFVFVAFLFFRLILIDTYECSRCLRIRTTFF